MDNLLNTLPFVHKMIVDILKYAFTSVELAHKMKKV